jgi:hypothetical protein
VVLDVTAGQNKVNVSTSGINCWYNDQTDFDTADIVNVAADATEQITFHLNGPNACGSGEVGAL